MPSLIIHIFVNIFGRGGNGSEITKTGDTSPKGERLPFPRSAEKLLLVALGGHCGSTSSGCLGIEVITAGVGDLQFTVNQLEVVHQRNTGGDVELGDVLVRDVVEVLHHGAQGITVGGNQDVLAGLEVLLDALVVVGNQAIDDVQQAFGEGNLV